MKAHRQKSFHNKQVTYILGSLLLGMFVSTPSVADASPRLVKVQSTLEPCDRFVRGHFSFSELQSEIDTVADRDGNGRIVLCLDEARVVHGTGDILNGPAGNEGDARLVLNRDDFTLQSVGIAKAQLVKRNLASAVDWRPIIDVEGTGIHLKNLSLVARDEVNDGPIALRVRQGGEASVVSGVDIYVDGEDSTGISISPNNKLGLLQDVRINVSADTATATTSSRAIVVGSGGSIREATGLNIYLGNRRHFGIRLEGGQLGTLQNFFIDGLGSGIVLQSKAHLGYIKNGTLRSENIRVNSIPVTGIQLRSASGLGENSILQIENVQVLGADRAISVAGASSIGSVDGLITAQSAPNEPHILVQSGSTVGTLRFVKGLASGRGGVSVKVLTDSSIEAIRDFEFTLTHPNTNSRFSVEADESSTVSLLADGVVRVPQNSDVQIASGVSVVTEVERIELITKDR